MKCTNCNREMESSTYGVDMCDRCVEILIIQGEAWTSQEELHQLMSKYPEMFDTCK